MFRFSNRPIADIHRVPTFSIAAGLLTGALLFSCTPPSTRPAAKQSPSAGQENSSAAWEIHRQCAALGKCINLGNALDAPAEGAWGVTLQESYFSHVKSLGFNSVRIPVRWSTHVDSTEPWTIDPVFFDRVQWAIEQARKNGLRAIVNVHHFEGLMSDPAANRPVFLSIWQQVAQRFAGYGPEVYFELCNEPSGALTPDKWNTLAAEALSVVRASNPQRSVIIGPGNWNSVTAINELQMPADSFLIATVHYYEPMAFTHQGASWISGTSAWLGTQWRAQHQDTLTIIAMFDRMSGWAKRHSIPVFLGEFGAIDTADSVSRALYTSFIAHQATARDWSYACWKYNGNFGFYNDTAGTTLDWLVSALIRPDSTFKAWMRTAAADTTPADPGSDRFLLLDDFDDSLPERNALFPDAVAKGTIPPDAPCCSWSVWYKDSCLVTDGAGTPVLPVREAGNGGRKSNFELLVGDRGATGKGLHARGYIRGDNYPGLTISTPLPGSCNHDWFDLSSLTAITFRAKGYGAMRVSFITDTVLNGYPQGDNWGHFGCEFGLSPEWKLYTIPVKSITPKPWSRPQQESLPWSAAMKKVCSVEFATSQSYDRVANDSIEIRLDDIRLYGLTENIPVKR